MKNKWGIKDPAAVKAFFDELESYSGLQPLEVIIKPELIGISMLLFVEGYTTYSCSGHVTRDDRYGFSVLPPKIDFAYSETGGNANEFHERICSIEVEYNGKTYTLRTPGSIKDKISAIFNIPDIGDLGKGSYRYILCGEGGKETYDHTCVTILENFWIQFSEILAEFADPEIYQARHGDFIHEIRDGKMFTPFAKKPNEGLDITGKFKLIRTLDFGNHAMFSQDL
jgi:hypothetical protein